MTYNSANHKQRIEVLAVGPLATKIVTGLALLFELLVGGLKAQAIPYRVIDASAGTSTRSSGAFSLRRTFGVIFILLQYIRYIGSSNIVYVTIGCSKLGFLRDCFVILLGSILRRRVVLHLHGGGYRDFYHCSGLWWRAAIRNTLNRADVIIVEGELLRKQFNFLSADSGPKIVVVPNGIPHKLSSRRTPKVLPRRGDVKILFLSNMIPSKGYMETLEACHLLNQGEEKYTFKCDFAGEFLGTGSGMDAKDPKFARLEFLQRIDEYHLSKIVRYHGVVRGNQKRDLLAAAHVLVLPTRYPGEGQPVCIIEALSQGIPVVSTRYRGIPEMIESGENGILLDRATAAEIARAVRQIAKNTAGYRRMSAKSIEIFRQRFARETHINNLIAIITEA